MGIVSSLDLLELRIAQLGCGVKGRISGIRGMLMLAARPPVFPDFVNNLQLTLYSCTWWISPPLGGQLRVSRRWAVGADESPQLCGNALGASVLGS